MQVSIAGANRRLPLGLYPDKSLADARQMAADKRKALASMGGSGNPEDAPTTLLELINAYARTTGDLKSWQRGEAQKRLKSVLAPLLVTPLAKLDARTYNRSRYTPQIATALQQLADYLDTLQTPLGPKPN